MLHGMAYSSFKKIFSSVKHFQNSFLRKRTLPCGPHEGGASFHPVSTQVDFLVFIRSCQSWLLFLWFLNVGMSPQPAARGTSTPTSPSAAPSTSYLQKDSQKAFNTPFRFEFYLWIKCHQQKLIRRPIWKAPQHIAPQYYVLMFCLQISPEGSYKNYLNVKLQYLRNLFKNSAKGKVLFPLKSGYVSSFGIKITLQSCFHVLTSLSGNLEHNFNHNHKANLQLQSPSLLAPAPSF